MGEGERERERIRVMVMLSFATLGSSRLSQAVTLLSSEEDDEDEEPLPATRMGFYETVASAHASATNINRRAFRVSVNKPELQKFLEMQEDPEDSVHTTVSMIIPPINVQVSPSSFKLPQITNSSIVANSSFTS